MLFENTSFEYQCGIFKWSRQTNDEERILKVGRTKRKLPFLFFVQQAEV